MRSAAHLEYEAAKERGEVRIGPLIRLDLTAGQMTTIQFALMSQSQLLVPLIDRERDPVKKATLLSGLRELMDLMRLMGGR